MDSLFQQLDLAIYSAAPVHWWLHPLAQALMAVVLTGAVFLIIVIMRKRKSVTKEPDAQRILALLYQSAVLWQQNVMQQTDILAVLTALVRKYSCMVIGDARITSMTDEQWLTTVESCDRFREALPEATRVVALFAQYKFSGKSLDNDQIKELFELVYQFIAKSSSGAIAPTSGLFAVRSDSSKT